MEPVEVVVVFGDDWDGLYVNGELYEEGHSIRVIDFVNLINEVNNFKSAIMKSLNREGLRWLDDCGDLPFLLSEIPPEFFE